MKNCETCTHWHNGEFSIYCVDCRKQINYKEGGKSMNYMPEILKMLGIEIDEKFKINFSCEKERLSHYFYKFDASNENCHLIRSDDTNYDEYLIQLLSGKYVIKKQPWKPELDDCYYFVDAEGGLSGTDWRNHAYDYILYNTGNCFRTKEEITSEIKDRILNKMKEKYENS